MDECLFTNSHAGYQVGMDFIDWSWVGVGYGRKEGRSMQMDTKGQNSVTLEAVRENGQN